MLTNNDTATVNRRDVIFRFFLLFRSSSVECLTNEKYYLYTYDKSSPFPAYYEMIILMPLTCSLYGVNVKHFSNFILFIYCLIGRAIDVK